MAFVFATPQMTSIIDQLLGSWGESAHADRESTENTTMSANDESEPKVNAAANDTTFSPQADRTANLADKSMKNVIIQGGDAVVDAKGPAVDGKVSAVVVNVKTTHDVKVNAQGDANQTNVSATAIGVHAVNSSVTATWGDPAGIEHIKQFRLQRAAAKNK